LLNEREFEETEEKNQEKGQDNLQELETEISSENISDNEFESKSGGDWCEQEWYKKINNDKYFEMLESINKRAEFRNF